MIVFHILFECRENISLKLFMTNCKMVSLELLWRIKWAVELNFQTDAFSSSRREVRWAQMRLAKDWDYMISGTEYGTYRGPVHSVVRAYMMALTGLHPPWSSCKNQAMQLQLLALPSNSTEGSMTFWVPFLSLVTNRWTSTIFFCCHLATTYCKSTDMSSLFIFPVHYAHECMMSELWSILKWLFCLCSELGASTNEPIDTSCRGCLLICYKC